MNDVDASLALTRPRPREQRFGLGCALITPFAADGSVDRGRLVAHARQVLGEGCASVTLFGTTGEGASLGLASRAAAIDAMVAAGFDFPRQVLAGVAAASIEDAVAQADQLTDAGGRGLLLAPPFYFKGPGDEGLYRWFSTVLERARAPREVILYHIPSVTDVPLSSTLIGRLARAFPGVIAGDQGFERRLGDDAALPRRPPAAPHPGRRRAPARAGRPPRRQRRDQRLLELLRAPAAADGRRGHRGSRGRRPGRPRAAVPGDAGGQGAGRASLRRRRLPPRRRHRWCRRSRRRGRSSPRRSTRCRPRAPPDAACRRRRWRPRCATRPTSASRAGCSRARSAPASSCRSANCARSPECRWARSARWCRGWKPTD